MDLFRKIKPSQDLSSIVPEAIAAKWVNYKTL